MKNALGNVLFYIKKFFYNLQKIYFHISDSINYKIKKYKTQKISIMVIPHKANKAFSFNLNKVHFYFFLLPISCIFIAYIIYLVNKSFLATEISSLQEKRRIIFYERQLLLEKANQIKEYQNDLKKSIARIYKKSYLSNEVNNQNKNLFNSENVLLKKVNLKLKEESNELIKNIDRHLRDPNFIFSIDNLIEEELKDFTQNYQYKNFKYNDDNVQYSLLYANSNEIKNSIITIKNFLKINNEVFEFIPFYWPSYGSVTSTYGWRSSPFGTKKEFHSGFDIANVVGTKVYAPANGIVKKANYSSGYGLNIIIQHKFDYKTIFAHLSRIYVRVGQRVERGQVIGNIGSTGRTTGPHLHYEIKINEVNVNPQNYLLFR